MKKISKIIRVMLVAAIFASTITTASAMSSEKFGLQIIDFDPSVNDWDGVGSKETNAIPNGSDVNLGQILQVDLDYLEKVNGFLGANLVVEFNSKLVEPLYYLNDSAQGLQYYPLDVVLKNGFFPHGRSNTTWAQTFNVSSDGSKIIVGLTPGTDLMTVEKTGYINSIFFRVKSDAKAGSEIRFQYYFSSGSDSSSVSTQGNNKGFLQEPAWVNVAGGPAVEENNTLSSVKATGGVHDYLEGVFDASNEGPYELVVPNHVDSLKLSSTLADPLSGTNVLHGQLDGPNGNSTGSDKLKVGDNYFITNVNNSKGDLVKTYSYTVRRLSNSTDIVVSGQDNLNRLVTFNNGEFNTVVLSDASYVDMFINNKGSGAEVSLEAASHVLENRVTIQTELTKTPFSINIIPEESLPKYEHVKGNNAQLNKTITKNYTFERKSGDNTSSLVEVKDLGGNVLKDWKNPVAYVFEHTVSNTVENIAISITPNHRDAQIIPRNSDLNLSNIRLNPGMNEFLIDVNAPDGNKQLYTFKINRTPRTANNLTNLSVKMGNVELNNPTTTIKDTMNFEVAYQKDPKVSLLASANTNEGASVKSGNITNQVLKLGLNTFKVIVKAEDGGEKTYTINITVKDNDQSDIVGDLEATNPETPLVDGSVPGESDAEGRFVYRYSMNVGNEKTTFSIADLKFSLPDNAQVVGGELMNLAVGENTFTFDVVSQDGKSKSHYIISVTRAKNSIASLESIQITSSPQGQALTGSLEKGYTYKVPAEVDSYTVSAKVAEGNGSVVQEDTVGNFILDGDKTHTVIVKSEDGLHTKEYTINIIRAKSTDPSLKSVLLTYGEISDHEIIGLFKNQKYEFSVDKEISHIRVNPTTSHSKSNYTINGGSAKDFELAYGVNTFAIDVRSETDVRASYTIQVNRAKNNDANLKYLELNSKTIDGWNVNTTQYNIGEVGENVSKLDLTYEASDVNASVTVHDNHLIAGVVNTVRVVVTAQDGVTTKTYNIIVERALSSSADLGPEGIIPSEGNESNHRVDVDSLDPTQYTVYVPFGTKTYSKTDFKLDLPIGAKVTYEQDSINLINPDPQGLNKFRFTVTSPNDANHKDYVITIKHMDSARPIILNVFINGIKHEEFVSETDKETVIMLNKYIGEHDKNFEFTVETTEGTDSWIVDTPSPLIEVKGLRSIKRQVMIQRLNDSLTRLYQFNFTRSLSSNVEVTDIVVDGGVLQPSFAESPDGPFQIDVPANQDNITIHPTTKNPNVSVEGSGKIDLVAGKNVVTIVVKSEDGLSEKKYDIVVNRAIELESLNLGNIAVDLTTASKVGNTVTYTISEAIPADLVEAELKAVAKDPTVKISSPANSGNALKLNNKEITFTLKDRSESTTLNVVLKYNRMLSDDARLKTLTLMVKNENVLAQFNPDTFEYNLKVDHDVVKVDKKDFTWEVMHPNTSVEAPVTLLLSNKEMNLYTISTKSESGVTQSYKINIEKDVYNVLEDLCISKGDGHLIESPFDPKKSDYTALVYPTAGTFSFEWVLADGVTVVNASSLKNIAISELPRSFDINVQGNNDLINTYTVSVELGVSTRLTGMESSQGSIVILPDQTEYTVLVPRDAKEVSLFNIETEDPKATYSGNYENIKLTQDVTGPVEIIVENQGYFNSYFISFEKTDDLTAIKQVVANNGPNRWVSTTLEDGSFELTVDFGLDLKNLELTVDLVDPKGSYSISEGVVNGLGGMDYTVIVTDVNGITKTYKVQLKNDLSDNNLLDDLTVNGQSVPGFNPPGANYQFNIKEGEAFEVNGITSDPSAEIHYKIPEPLVDGSIVEVTVVSAKGTPRIYTIKASIEKANTAILDSLEVVGHKINPDFNPVTQQYYLGIHNSVEKLTVNYQAAGGGSVRLESNATVVGDTVSNLIVGKNVINVIVTAEDGTEFTYIIHVTRNVPSENFLSDLRVKSRDDGTKYSLSPTFNPKTSAYTITVPKGQSSFTVEADHNENLRVGGLGDIDLVSYPYAHTVKVIDEQGIVNPYTVTFIEEPSKNVGLSNLWTSEGGLSPVFETETLNYAINVPYESKTIEIFYTVREEGQIVQNAGLHLLTPGLNEIEIKVSQGGASQIYTISVIRGEDVSAKLDWLEVSQGKLSPSFKSDNHEYFVNLDGEIDSIDITAGSSLAGVTIEGTGNKLLEVGSNVFEIIVKSEDGSQSSYFVFVNRGPVEGLDLIYLEIIGETMNEAFDPNRLEYTSNLKLSKYDLLHVVAVAKNQKATVTVTGNKNLKAGENLIKVRVALSETEFQDTIIRVNLEDRYLQSNIHIVGERYIESIHEKQSVLDVKNQMLNDNSDLKIYYEGVELKDDYDGYVGTGSIIKLVVDGQEYDHKTIIVKGDVNGNGLIDLGDMQMVQTVLLGGSLNEIQMIAAEVSGDEEVNIPDFVKIRAHIISLVNIFDKVGDV